MLTNTNDATRRRAGLRQLLTTKRTTCSELAREIGLPTPNALFNFLNGHSASLSLETIERILTAHPDMSFHDLVGLKPLAPAGRNCGPNSLIVTIELCAAVRRSQVELPAEEWTPAPLLAPQRSDSADLFAARVRYPGAEQLYPNGSVLLCRRLGNDSPTPPDGTHVIVVHRRRANVKVTLRNLHRANGEVWLWPCSTHPHHQKPLQLCKASPGPDDAAQSSSEVILLGEVIASWQPAPTDPPT